MDMEFLNGHLRTKPNEIRVYATVAACAPFLSEAPGEILLHDDRFLQNNAEGLQAMREEQQYVASVHPRTWELFAEHIPGDVAGPDSRHSAMLASRRICGFAYKEVFRQSSFYPFSLTWRSASERRTLARHAQYRFAHRGVRAPNA